jgi:hypothetical protein
MFEDDNAQAEKAAAAATEQAAQPWYLIVGEIFRQVFLNTQTCFQDDMTRASSTAATLQRIFD